MAQEEEMRSRRRNVLVEEMSTYCNVINIGIKVASNNLFCFSAFKKSIRIQIDNTFFFFALRKIYKNNQFPYISP